MQNRIIWIDYVKSFGIFLMVLCHAKLNCDIMVTAIYTFHMPLFFFLSGYFDKGEGITRGNVIKSLKTLIIPYFFFKINIISKFGVFFPKLADSCQS